ncbi:tetratricopeptide repeat protein [Candidatus Latescibacterota bacterium]
MNRYAVSVVIIILSMLCMSCGKKPVADSTVLDTLPGIYSSGLSNLAANKVKEAETDFNKILKVDKKSPMGLTGLALIDLKGHHFRRCLGRLDKALKYDPDYVDAHVVRGRVFTEQGRNGWKQDALDAFATALELDSDNQPALYYQGECYIKAYDFTKATRSFELASQQQGGLNKATVDRHLLVEKILEAGPLTEAGKAIALTASIDRATLCMLLIEELDMRNLLKIHRNRLFYDLFHDDFKPRKSKKIIPMDISSHPNRHMIFPFATLGLPDLTVFPDGRFYPDRKVSRDQYAVIMYGICNLLEMGDGDTNTESMIVPEDVHVDHYAFEAILYCLQKNFMQSIGNSGFRPSEEVSGVDAVFAICALREEYKWIDIRQ